MTTHANSPHPFLTEPVLYVVDPCERLKLKTLKKTFKWLADDITECEIPGVITRHTWAIRFGSIRKAELALATRHNQPALYVLPPVMISLSHSLNVTEPPRIGPLFPQYVKAEPGFFAKAIPAQTAFTWFRTAGPLAYVRTDVDIGDEQRTIVVEFFEEEHARFARNKTNALCKALRKRPKFTLRTYDPCTLRCSGFASAFSYGDLVETFSQFGTLANVSLNNTGDQTAYGVVTFENPDCAAQALQETNGKTIGVLTLLVRYEEPTGQNHFRRASPNTTSPGHSSSSTTGDSSVPPDDPSDEQADEAEARDREERLRREAIARQAREAAERRAQEAARQAAEAKLQKLREQRLRRDEVERTNAEAKAALEAALLARVEVSRDFELAQQVQEKVDQELEEVSKACAEAKQLWLEALARKRLVAQQAESLQETLRSAEQRKQQVDVDIKTAEETERSSRLEREQLDRELASDGIDEEIMRQAELAESIRRMQELRAIEEMDRLERANRRRQQEEAELRRQREEAERAAREQREQEEAARREAESRQRLYDQAVARERERCRLRDNKLFKTSHPGMSAPSRALERFNVVSSEFESIKFSDSQPLTFESVPWPILINPGYMKFEDIEWDAVEKFFGVVEALTQSKAEFRALLEKSLRRLHPDKWGSKLKSVWDQELRDHFEAAANIVTQAITALVQKARQS